MKKCFIVSTLLSLSSIILAQVGINTQDPKATIHIVGQPTDISCADGIIVPRITGVQLRLKNSAYNAAQNAAIVYVTSADTAPSGKTINVTSPGYYYYDAGNFVWQTLKGGESTTVTASNGLTETNNNIKLGGALTGPTFITGINATNRLSFIGSGLNAINFMNNTLSIDASNLRVGVGTSTPAANLDINGTARITGSVGTSNFLLGRNTPGDVSAVFLGNGLSLSGNVLTATAGNTTEINAYLIKHNIRAYNVLGQNTVIVPANDDYTVWVSGNPNVGAGNCQLRLPVTRVGRVINIVAALDDLVICAEGISGTSGGGWITTHNGGNYKTFTIPSTKRASFQYIGTPWHTEGTWVLTMKDF